LKFPSDSFGAIRQAVIKNGSATLPVARGARKKVDDPPIVGYQFAVMMNDKLQLSLNALLLKPRGG
jgi:hypothetical protein